MSNFKSGILLFPVPETLLQDTITYRDIQMHVQFQELLIVSNFYYPNGSLGTLTDTWRSNEFKTDLTTVYFLQVLATMEVELAYRVWDVVGICAFCEFENCVGFNEFQFIKDGLDRDFEAGLIPLLEGSFQLTGGSQTSK